MTQPNDYWFEIASHILSEEGLRRAEYRIADLIEEVCGEEGESEE